MRTSPALAQVRRAVRQALPAGRVVVACSGGADSLALAAAVAFEAARSGPPAGLITVDHGLQPGSAARAAAVATLGHELGLDPVVIVPVAVDGGGGLEAAARTARYAALDGFAAALDADLLLGHTLDDQAETVLLGLGRGSGPRSIAGMRAVDGRRIRPLLGVRRAATAAACAALGFAPWEDPHNRDPRFQRARLRGEVLPLLEDVLAGGVAEALARTASLLREDLDALDELARAQLAALAPAPPGEGVPTSGRAAPPVAVASGVALPVAALSGLPRALRTRVLRQWARAGGTGPLTAAQLVALDALITVWHGQGAVDLPGGFRVARASGRLALAPSINRQE
ncbi:MAG: tRNA lysidine(34) synthetase TilS [Actinomycetia bacterium]|nr:tRNA lysidine(34) synthetase TilS [Actinomycetes bacterium]